MSEVWRLDLATLRWETMPILGTGRCVHGCCAVRGALVVIGGVDTSDEGLSSVEIIRNGGTASRGPDSGFTELPPLSCGGIANGAAVAVDESDSAAGQVLLVGGNVDYDYDSGVGREISLSDDGGGCAASKVHLVDLATGMCQPLPDLLSKVLHFATARLPDGRVAFAGGGGFYGTIMATAEVWQPPVQGALDTAWTRRELPEMSVQRWAGRACALSDGRLAVIGGITQGGITVSSCEALKIGADEHWEFFPSMHDVRSLFACVAVAGCVVVAGGETQNAGGNLETAEVFDEWQGRWLRLPCVLAHAGGLSSMGFALL